MRYATSARYPNGWADAAGYWAEHHIFGGVLLFDRGESEEEVSRIILWQVFCGKRRIAT